jgi:hypothetical protein
MENIAAILTSEITVLVTRTANIAITRSNVTIVTRHIIVTIVTFDSMVIGAIFAPNLSSVTIPRTVTNGNLGRIVTIFNSVTTLAIDTMVIDAIFAPKVTVRIFDATVNTHFFSTTRTDVNFVNIGTSDTTGAYGIIRTEQTPLNGGFSHGLDSPNWVVKFSSLLYYALLGALVK